MSLSLLDRIALSCSCAGDVHDLLQLLISTVVELVQILAAQ